MNEVIFFTAHDISRNFKIFNASTDMHMHLLRVELPVLADVVPQVSVQVVSVVLHEGDLLQVARDILPVLFANAI